jgi:hypothetical protein
MPLVQPSVSISQRMPRVVVVLERVVVAVILDLISDGAGTVEAVPVARKSYVLGVGLLNAQGRVLCFQRVAPSYNHISHLLVQLFLNFLAVSTRQKKIVL